MQTVHSIVFAIDSYFDVNSNRQFKSSSAIVKIREHLTRLVINPDIQVQLEKLVLHLAEQMLSSYQNPDSPLHVMC